MVVRGRFSTTKQKATLFLALLLVLYMYLFFGDHSTALMRHIKVLTSSSSEGDENNEVGHQIGQIITHHNGSFLYFHLPSLTDYRIERDYYRLKLSEDKTDSKEEEKLCLRIGTEEVVQQGKSAVCVCKDNDYTGEECSVPPIVHRTVNLQPPSKSNSKSNSLFGRLLRPRRILVSFVWPTYDDSTFKVVKNVTITGKEARLKKLVETMNSMAVYVDLFVIHELRVRFELKTDNQTQAPEEEEDKNSIKYQMAKKDRPLGRHSAYSLLYSTSTVVYLDKSSQSQANENLVDLTSFEESAARKTWFVLTQQITEYRPADLLLFMSTANFPSETLLRFLKYHTGLMDIVHLLPIHQLKLAPAKNISSNLTNKTSPGNATLQITAKMELDSQATEPRLNAFLSVDKVSNSFSNFPKSYHLRNVMFTFELMTFLCRYEYEAFLTSYCLTKPQLVDRFQGHFWPIRLTTVGSSQIGNLSATFSIP